ncbi:hypothetical protein GOFOIKOB_0014 [Methylobacterium tardum]|uniref:Uncharacterized protein n=1 Tax=Methylobacterium tardum TaxID=374432 RepID=A0AA37TI07_9HYPH|nr:hypothetical protein [Methylobacterium tardum]GJE46995.1 hypothetical protein GOFOIKOB_0014 [Methylobacterium tardum]GLS71633.1 hypothetical protein GCM10007890_36460 [Methylobacterium tardum]
MRLTERQARIRLGEAVARAGGQVAFARGLQGVSPKAAESIVSKSLLGRQRVAGSVLAYLGLRRDAAGDIHTVEPPSRIEVLAVRAEGDAGVRAAAALVDGILGPRP